MVILYFKVYSFIPSVREGKRHTPTGVLVAQSSPSFSQPGLQAHACPASTGRPWDVNPGPSPMAVASWSTAFPLCFHGCQNMVMEEEERSSRKHAGLCVDNGGHYLPCPHKTVLRWIPKKRQQCSAIPTKPEHPEEISTKTSPLPVLCD